MFRLLGFLIGSASAIVMLLVVLGIPDFHLPDATSDQQRFDAAVEKLKEKQQVAAEVAEMIVEEVATAVDEVQDNIEIVAEKALPQLSAQMDQAFSEDEGEDEAIAPITDDTTIAGDLPIIVEDLRWYSFWNPFRSEIAANGFVSRLEKVTGLDYRVVKVKTGVYEVAFAFADDMERRSKISQISLATGLELPDS